MDLDDNKYYLEKVEIPIYEESEFDYDFVKSDDILILEDKSSDSFEHTSKVLDELQDDEKALEEVIFNNRPKLTTIPPSMDDYIRSFLLRLGLTRTLDCFQLEWFEKKHKGLLHEEDTSEVPDIYVRNQQLDTQVKLMREDRNKYKQAALNAKEMHVKLRSERDYHKLQHRRMVQEKNKLIDEIKRLRDHYATYQPALEQLQQKYQTAMKEKMLSKLERDRICGQMQGLQMTLQSLENSSLPILTGDDGKRLLSRDKSQISSIHPCQKGGVLTVDKMNRGITQRKLAEARECNLKNNNNGNCDKENYDTPFPIDKGINEDLLKLRPPPGHLTRVGGFKLANTIKAHDGAVTSVKTHKNKKIFCTTSDDDSWKLWSIDSLQVLMTGKGHTNWVSSAAFDNDGSKLATASGDTSLKIWNLSEAECLHTFDGHSQAIWSVDWHTLAPFVATASHDKTIKVWDLNSLRCRSILRGHSDSVNSVQFLINSNILLTSSVDKTICLWDARTSICGQSILGHQHSVNSANINPQGTSIVSCDAFGFVKFWDCRQLMTPIKSIDLGFHPANDVRYDTSGACVALSSSDCLVKMIETASFNVSTLVGHEDAVQSSSFDFDGEFLISASADCTVKIWS